MSPEDPNQTLRVGGANPSGLLRYNALHIVGSMVANQPAGMEQEGDSIGPYHLIEMLGEGGFGIVWRAEQTEPVRREVALKVIKSGMDTMQVLSRFNQERQALASLDHPNIATLLNAGVTGDGRPYFAMEMVRGGPVTSWCAINGATLQLRLRLFIQICQAVQHAHEKGILHRDLKPPNILVTEVDGEPAPKVIDFGIAKAITTASSLQDLTMLTQAGQVLGTPLYMSPEQIVGGKELDVRTDIYALGVLLYELLTGGLPFDATMFRTGDIASIKHLILETIPERPSTRLRRRTTNSSEQSARRSSLPLSLPLDLDWITLRAMEKSRERRYSSAQELAADIQRHLGSQRVLARAPSFGGATSRWIRRHRAGFIAAAASSVLSGIVIGGALLWKSVNEADSVVELTAHGSFTNSLGMKFVPVPVIGGPTSGQPVLFSIWEMRVQDYEVFAKETKRAWPRPDFEQDPTHPAVNVNWEDATAFCAWLTKWEQKAGKLAPGDAYRLPSDHEWSCAAGIGEREDGNSPPRLKNEKIPLEFPWGAKLPAPNDAGNYRSDELRALQEAGIARQIDSNFDGRMDGFGGTAPVASYAPNRFGLYDLGGNAWEWCEEWFDLEQTERVVRGGCWSTTRAHHLLSSCRNKNRPAMRGPFYGVRVVLASTSFPAASKVSGTAPPITQSR